MADVSVARAAVADAMSELVARARRGDAAAFDALARAGIDRTYRLALAILRSEPDARDAAQDAWLSAWRQLPGLRDPDRFPQWIDRIVVNACRMQLRHRRVVRLREIDVGDPASHVRPGDPLVSASAPDDRIADVELVQMAMERLGVDQRAVLVLHHIEDRPVAEIAAVLGSPLEP